MNKEPIRYLTCDMCKWFLFSNVSMCSICKKHGKVLKGRFERPCTCFKNNKEEKSND